METTPQTKIDGVDSSLMRPPPTSGLFPNSSSARVSPVVDHSSGTQIGATVQQQQQLPPQRQNRQGQELPVEQQQGMQRQDSSFSSMSASSEGTVDVAVVNVKYRNDDGRNAILSRSLSLHHDFGSLTSIVNVTLTRKDLDDLANDPNIHWVDRTGAVHYIQPSALGL